MDPLASKRTIPLPNHGYAVQFDQQPAQSGGGRRLGCIGNDNFGISGQGCLYIFNLDDVSVQPAVLPWHDALYNLSWNESNPNLIATGSGDGSVLVWDLLLPQNPVGVFQLHQKEVETVEWGHLASENMILSSSWDGRAIIFDAVEKQPTFVFGPLPSLIHTSKWSPDSSLFALGSSDGFLSICDMRLPNSEAPLAVRGHAESLCCDWSKFDPLVVASGGSEGRIIGRDIRQFQQELFFHTGHTSAVKSLKFSLHQPSVLVSASYDRSTRIWNSRLSPLSLEEHWNHTEFVYGVDISLAEPGLVADCGWDKQITLFKSPLLYC